MAEWQNTVLQGRQTRVLGRLSTQHVVWFIFQLQESPAPQARGPASRPLCAAGLNAGCGHTQGPLPPARLPAVCTRGGQLHRVLEPGLAQGSQLAQQSKACAALWPGRAWGTERPCCGRSPALAPSLLEGTCSVLAEGQQLLGEESLVKAEAEVAAVLANAESGHTVSPFKHSIRLFFIRS